QNSVARKPDFPQRLSRQNRRHALHSLPPMLDPEIRARADSAQNRQYQRRPEDSLENLLPGMRGHDFPARALTNLPPGAGTGSRTGTSRIFHNCDTFNECLNRAIAGATNSRANEEKSSPSHDALLGSKLVSVNPGKVLISRNTGSPVSFNIKSTRAKSRHPQTRKISSPCRRIFASNSPEISAGKRYSVAPFVYLLS